MSSNFAINDLEDEVGQKEWENAGGALDSHLKVPDDHYLESKLFKSRYVLAAHFLEDCETVIEIGGNNSTIDNYLNKRKEQRVIVCDPTIHPLDTENALYIQDQFENVDFSSYSDFGLCILGMDFTDWSNKNGTWTVWDHVMEKLLALVDQSKKMVIEVPSKYYKPSLYQLSYVTEHTSKKISAEIDLYFPHYDREGAKGLPNRRLVLFE